MRKLCNIVVLLAVLVCSVNTALAKPKKKASHPKNTISYPKPDENSLACYTQLSEPGKVTLCHIPPGNPANAHLITVGASAAIRHIINHGDFLAGPGCSCPPVPPSSSSSSCISSEESSSESSCPESSSSEESSVQSSSSSSSESSSVMQTLAGKPDKH